nr:ABC transporter permease [Anaerolineae bacterium]NIN94596.1 ABC transporter permease [Anaerolineae bacterium]NIQ77657.1 ABC transporter permease [Anaerolineae bacterium]
ITKESAIYARERLVNLGVLPYMMSKVSVLAILCLFQTIALVGIFAIRIDLGGFGTDVYPSLLAAIFLTELAGLAMGLLVSASVANSDRAMAVVPVLLIPQIIFAGALVPLEQMLAPARAVAQVMISKWSFQLTGSITDLTPRFSEQLPPDIGGPYASQFDTATWLPWVVLIAFTVAMLAAAVAIQKRKDIS